MRSNTFSNQYPTNFIYDVIVRSGGTISPIIVTNSIERGVEYALNGIYPKEKECILSYYKERKTMQKIADEQGLSRERVRQLINKGEKRIVNLNLSKYLIKGYDAVVNEIKAEQEVKETVQHSLQSITLDRMHQHNKISVRTYKALKKAGMNTLADVACVIKEKGLNWHTEIKAFGINCVNEIMVAMVECLELGFAA